ncbi:hypothetical protein BX070DRAFT_231720 [Coemansia spiralis]|nr:hypothetical protein BX070DRAFT_231720 [Coemansia spiralis]
MHIDYYWAIILNHKIGTPDWSYSLTLQELADVETSMKRHHETVASLMRDTEVLLFVGSFPKFGSSDFLEPPYKANSELSHSLFLSDEIINTHPRFRMPAVNIRKRDGSKVIINMLIFHNISTPTSSIVIQPPCTIATCFQAIRRQLKALLF